MNGCIGWSALIFMVSGVCVLGGCGPDFELTNWQSRVIEGADSDQVLLAAARVLRREFGHVRVNHEARTIEAQPVEFGTVRGSGTARDLYGGRSTMRRAGRFSVGRRGTAAVARMRIEVQREDTARALTMQPPTGRVSDSPAYTPIERDAATTERQNTIWTTVRRDRRLERELLDEIGEEFAAPLPVPAEQPLLP